MDETLAGTLLFGPDEPSEQQSTGRIRRVTKRPLFVSIPVPVSDKFWREYRVYDDRVELETVLGVMTIPFDEIDQIETGQAQPAGRGSGSDALVIDRNQGWVRRVRIRPHEPDGFRRALETALTRHRAMSPIP